MTPSANWSLSACTVHTKSGAAHVGSAAQVFEDASGAPVLVQVNKGDHYAEVPWPEVLLIEHV